MTVETVFEVEEEDMERIIELGKTLGIPTEEVMSFALNLMKAHFTIDQLKSEVIVHGPKDHRRKE